MNTNQLRTINQKYNKGTASPEEIAYIEKWYEDLGDDSFEFINQQQRNELKTELYTSLKEQIHTSQESSYSTPKVRRFKFPVWWAAAVLALIATVGLYYEFKSADQKIVVNHTRKTLNGDVLPGGNRAILKLADGTEIILDSANTGMLAERGFSSVRKSKDGQVVFETNQQTQVASQTKPLINTLSTPRGGQYQIILPDGTKVWLNAASVLRFPNVFTGKQRVVELEGEAYFEVAKNTKMPFNVLVNNMKVEVLGTHFNIMAYADESSTNTTLLEGLVRIVKGNESKMIVPGEQALVNGSILVAKVNVQDAIAWKNGLTSFNNADIKSIMRQVERWYNVDVTFKGTFPPRTFTGEISRDANLSELFKILQLSNINFKIEGENVIVTP